MKTIELYLKILNEIRYGKLAEKQLNYNDYEFGSEVQQFLAQYNSAMNLLSDLIEIMEREIK